MSMIIHHSLKSMLFQVMVYTSCSCFVPMLIALQHGIVASENSVLDTHLKISMLFFPHDPMLALHHKTPISYPEIVNHQILAMGFFLNNDLNHNLTFPQLRPGKEEDFLNMTKDIFAILLVSVKMDLQYTHFYTLTFERDQR